MGMLPADAAGQALAASAKETGFAPTATDSAGPSLFFLGTFMILGILARLSFHQSGEDFGDSDDSEGRGNSNGSRDSGPHGRSRGFEDSSEAWGPGDSHDAGENQHVVSFEDASGSLGSR